MPYTISPSNNITHHSIESIGIIEAWNLDHNLANVVKYIEKACRNDQNLENFKKAEWYLDRAYSKKESCQRLGLNQQLVHFEGVDYLPQAVCEDWELTDLVCSTLINIYLSRQQQSHVLGQNTLLTALQYLREEILFLEKK